MIVEAVTVSGFTFIAEGEVEGTLPTVLRSSALNPSRSSIEDRLSAIKRVFAVSTAASTGSSTHGMTRRYSTNQYFSCGAAATSPELFPAWLPHQSPSTPWIGG